MHDKSFYGLPHIIEAQQFPRDWLDREFFPLVHEMEQVIVDGGNEILRKKLLFEIFTEASTRTSISFETAMKRLGGMAVVRENASELSSLIKGETDDDMYVVLGGYKPDVLVIRHHKDGAAALAAKVSGVPVINAGDGNGQHPTQSLTDIYTIKKELGRINGLSIAMVGDLLNGRTVRSLSYLLGKFEGVKIYFVAPPCLQMKPDIKAYLDRHSVSVTELNDVREVAPLVDVIYQTRIQKERGSSYDENDPSQGYFKIDCDTLTIMKPKTIIMHPLPRNKEIAPEVDKDKRAAYFRQAANGLSVRMALLKMILAPKA